MPRATFWTLATAAGLALGCGGGPGPNTEGGTYRIAVIPKGLTHEFWQSIHRGAERAAQDLEEKQHVRAQIIWDGPLKENDALEQINIINRNIANRVSGIVLAPQHSQQMVAPVERA